MNMYKIAFRLDAGSSIGLGHLIRCSALAKELQKYNNEIIFICRNKLKINTSYRVLYLNKSYFLPSDSYTFPSITDESNIIIEVLKKEKVQCLIVDHYGADDEYYKHVKDHVPYIVAIDDGVKRNIPVNMIINGNLYGIRASYGEAKILLLGGSYTLLREEFSHMKDKKIQEKIQNIYITSGGADPLGFCMTFLHILQQLKQSFNIHIIVGADFDKTYIENLSASIAILHRDANMADADLFITGSGSTLYELAASGVPSISYILADDQINVANSIWEAKCSIKGGYFYKLDSKIEVKRIKEVINNYRLRKNISINCRKTISCRGCYNVANELMKELDIRI